MRNEQGYKDHAGGDSMSSAAMSVALAVSRSSRNLIG